MPRRDLAAPLAALTLLLAAAPPSGAQEPEPPANVCQEEPGFRHFDFWIGEWAVFNNADGSRAGTNRIEAAHGGCVLIESWESARGGGGTSVNYYDNVTGRWRQVWVATNYSIDIAGGLDGEGRMVLEGELHDYRSRRSFPFRGTWTPLDERTVRQLFEQRNPETGEWEVWFDGRYERMGGGG